VSGEPYFLASGDFNGDGRTDLGVTAIETELVHVLLGRGDGKFRAAQTFPVGFLGRTPVTKDFDGDGLTDLALVQGRTVQVLLSGSAKRF
jgi:hypothetical protein